MMHAEWGSVDQTTASALNEARRRGGRVIAVGTTALRLLETARRRIVGSRAFEGWTDIFITPGYAVPGCGLPDDEFPPAALDLVHARLAFRGLDRMRDAYRHAIAGGYRFYSYGDACFLERSAPVR
jgi:S-adenosylmethionine:tRNA ribosyltransferase-isomerase